MRIVLGGPPRSGKSCLRERLRRVLRERHGIYAYALTANPDGEGSWYQETVAHDPDLAQRLKAAHKRPWSDDAARLWGEWVRRCDVPVALVDVGGKPDYRNEIICAAASHLVALAAKPDAFQPWREFGRKLGLVMLAELVSDYDGAADTVEAVGADGVVRGVVHHLERGELEGARPAIEALAGRIAEIAQPRRD